jgi:hypothetical protein
MTTFVNVYGSKNSETGGTIQHRLLATIEPGFPMALCKSPTMAYKTATSMSVKKKT